MSDLTQDTQGGGTPLTQDNISDSLENENIHTGIEVESLPILLQHFLQTYKEFNPLLENNKDDILRMFEKIACLYPSYKKLLTQDDIYLSCGLYYPFFMLVAHYLIVNGFGVLVGINKPSGIVTSSSIDSVSVSYQTAPFKDNFQYFFSQTPYGLEYLAYLNTQSGIMLIN